MKTTTELNSLSLSDKSSDTLYLRSGVTLAFFLPMPFAVASEAAARVVEAYLQFIPPGALKWASVGADSQRWSAIGPKTLDKCKRLLGAQGAAERELTAFELGDGEQGGDAPGFGLKVIGNPPDDDLPLEQNLIEMHLPWDYLGDDKREDLVAFARAAAYELPYCSGYLAPALQWSEHKTSMAFDEAAALIRRHPGLDISQNELGRSDLGDKTRGARWLTFLGSEALKKLGGRAALEPALTSVAGITVSDAGQGLMIRAGKVPELGDRERGEKLVQLCHVVDVLAPVTLDEAAIFESYFDDDSFAKVWAGRFRD